MGEATVFHDEYQLPGPYRVLCETTPGTLTLLRARSQQPHGRRHTVLSLPERLVCSRVSRQPTRRVCGKELVQSQPRPVIWHGSHPAQEKFSNEVNEETQRRRSAAAARIMDVEGAALAQAATRPSVLLIASSFAPGPKGRFISRIGA